MDDKLDKGKRKKYIYTVYIYIIIIINKNHVLEITFVETFDCYRLKLT